MAFICIRDLSYRLILPSLTYHLLLSSERICELSEFNFVLFTFYKSIKDGQHVS